MLGRDHKGTVFAFDLSARRLDTLVKRLASAGATRVVPVAQVLNGGGGEGSRDETAGAASALFLDRGSGMRAQPAILCPPTCPATPCI
jgi:hypothetical protein